uniref:DNA-directed DNA polymerase n=1 Tax=Romanomermis culicivorax TaxID=13658 RepID=A0A915KAR5_ROMCU
MTQAFLDNHQGSCRFITRKKLQAVLLPDYQIKIFSKEWFKDLIFRGHLCFIQPVSNKQIEEDTMQEKVLPQMELSNILKIFEVWHYDNVEQHHPTKNPEGGFFTQYLNTFMKMKLESEGYPARAQMDEQKCDYEMEVYNRENISLDPSKISKNPRKRALAKLMLNSFLGKFGQQNNMDKIIIYNSPKEYFQLAMNEHCQHY